MSIAIRFEPGLGAWLMARLDRAESEDSLVRTMTTEGMHGGVARAIVAAFVSARHAGTEPPRDAIVLDENALDYVDEPARLLPRRRIETVDRTVQVLLRLDRPPLAVLDGVLSPSECAEVIRLARPRLAPSTVVDPLSGKDVVAPYRQSYGAFFHPAENALIALLEQRVSAIMSLPLENSEGFQVLRYPEGGGSAPHFDFLEPSNESNRASLARSGQRVSTLVIYLNDVSKGGETVFPELGLSVSPAPGHGVYFEYANSLGQVDRRSLHACAPVLRGEKWVLTKWTRERRFASAGADPAPAARSTSSRDSRVNATHDPPR